VSGGRAHFPLIGATKKIGGGQLEVAIFFFPHDLFFAINKIDGDAQETILQAWYAWQAEKNGFLRDREV